MDVKTLQQELQSLGFTSSLAKPKMGRRLGDKGPAHKMRERNESE